MSITTRRPTGRPSWPIMLIAGGEKTGKSYASAVASSSDLVGRTFWVGVGEDDPDEYGAIPGARFEIVEHDGTYRGILNALTAAKDEPAKDQPNLIVLDSATRMWDLICDMAQAEANRRAVAKAKEKKWALPTEDVQITMDLWNVAKSRWQNILDTLRDHKGPSIVTARLEEVAVMLNGKPTTDKTMKIKAEKGLPYDVGVIVEMPRRGDAFLTGVRSVRLADKSEARIKLAKFTVDQLWRDLGLAERDATAPRTYPSADGQASVDAEDRLVTDRDALLARLREAVPDPLAVAQQWHKDHGHLIKDTTDLDSLAALVASHEAGAAA